MTAALPTRAEALAEAVQLGRVAAAVEGEAAKQLDTNPKYTSNTSRGHALAVLAQSYRAGAANAIVLAEALEDGDFDEDVVDGLPVGFARPVV